MLDNALLVDLDSLFLFDFLTINPRLEFLSPRMMLWFDLLKLMHCAFWSVILQISSRCYDDVESFLNKGRMRLLIKILKGLSRINLFSR